MVSSLNHIICMFLDLNEDIFAERTSHKWIFLLNDVDLHTTLSTKVS